MNNVLRYCFWAKSQIWYSSNNFHIDCRSYYSIQYNILEFNEAFLRILRGENKYKYRVQFLNLKMNIIMLNEGDK